jgi:hypothetical protein
MLRSGLTRKQQGAVRMLAQGFSHRAIAKEIGCSTSSLSRWKAEVPEFAFAMETTLRDLEQAARDQVRSDGTAAISKARQIVDEAPIDAPNLIPACRLLLEVHEKLVVKRDMEAEVNELRETVKQLSQVIEERTMVTA